MNPAPTDTSTIAIGYDWLRQNMLEGGRVRQDCDEGWDRSLGHSDGRLHEYEYCIYRQRKWGSCHYRPFHSVRWAEELEREGLAHHLLYTHTHRDHVVGYSSMIKLNPEVEVWGHEDARVPELVNHVVFERLISRGLGKIHLTLLLSGMSAQFH